MSVHVSGVEKAIAAFKQLPIRMQFKHIRIAMNAAAGVIRDKAKQLVPEETRLLKRSLAIKVKIPNASYNQEHWGRPEYAVIGPSRRAISELIQGVTKTGRLTSKRRISTSGKQSGEGGIKRASRYAHLVEHGHGGVRPARAQPFLGPAVRIAGTQAQQKALAKIFEGITKEAAALSAGP